MQRRNDHRFSNSSIYQFSDGTKGEDNRLVNEEGVKFYNDLINTLKENGETSYNIITHICIYNILYILIMTQTCQYSNNFFIHL